MASLQLLNRRVLTIFNCNNTVLMRVSFRPCCKTPRDAPPACKHQNKPASVADRTINLAHQQNKYCVKPVQRSLVVHPKPCAALPLRPVITPVCAKPIRVCRAEDMKKICPPKPCTCPPRKPKETWQQKLKRLVLFVVKVAVVAGIVYLTIEAGIWEDGDQAVEFYQSVLSTLMLIYPGAEVDAKEVKIPKTDKMVHQAKQMWNKMVVLVCGFIGTAPGRVIGLVIKPKECDQDQGSSRGGRSAVVAMSDELDPCEEEEECE